LQIFTVKVALKLEYTFITHSVFTVDFNRGERGEKKSGRKREGRRFDTVLETELKHKRKYEYY